jgi:hypothetical protein
MREAIDRYPHTVHVGLYPTLSSNCISGKHPIKRKHIYHILYIVWDPR